MRLPKKRHFKNTPPPNAPPKKLRSQKNTPKKNALPEKSGKSAF